ncbi:SKI/DACH domain-containing protein 1 [Protopterus annectens]|uniref:SKI/DACH domain-containing protein 1 n=1 Tax=Protopterus annectens TaxID=7888 RepID=UPI001CFA496C|nr:SKI/DACH domain-containing protein 1 [Protopterus annectens]
MREMGDLESGYEEVDGVRLGYLRIKGKQMFALSQVFTDLLKNIPRTTVHKRMDYLKVKKHHCDLEELRKLKAINSIAFHAAKCTLISREDVEALYTSCKTERVLRRKTRKIGHSPTAKECGGYDQATNDPCPRLWKENQIWFDIKEGHQPLSIKRKSCSLGTAGFLPASNLPHIFSKYTGQCYPEKTRSTCKTPLNYETTPIASNYVAFHPSGPYFRSVQVCSSKVHPAFYQSAIAQPKFNSCDTTGLICKYKRKRSRKNNVEITNFGFNNNTKRVLLLPKSCRSKVSSSSSLGDGSSCPDPFQFLNGLYQSHHQGTFQESYSSDSESSSYSDFADNDSDVGSSLSSTSNSASSEEEEEERTVSESSDATSEEDTTSDTDSSSVSSQVSLQSIRFRRTSFSSLHTKPPVLAQANFLYQFQTKNNGLETTRRDESADNKAALCDFKPDPSEKRSSTSWTPKLRNGCCSSNPGGCLPEIKKDILDELSFPSSEFPNDTPGIAQTISCVKEDASSPRPKKFRELQEQNTFKEEKTCSPESTVQCEEQNTLDFTRSVNESLATEQAAKDLRTNSNCVPLSAELQLLKSDLEQEVLPTDRCNQEERKISFLPTVKIKVEENSEDEYEPRIPTADAKLKSECNACQEEFGTVTEVTPRDTASEVTEDSKGPEKQTLLPNVLTPSRKLPCTLDSRRAEAGEYKYGARVRKNYRRLVLGKRPALQDTLTKPNLKSDRGPRPAGKTEIQEGTLEDQTVTNRRKRLANNVASTIKRPFNFMANFPSPPSLIIGSDGDLVPAYSLNTTKNSQPPPKAHPVWKWQLGGSAIPLPPSHKFRKFNL